MTELAHRTQSSTAIDTERIGALRNLIAPDCNDAELELFIQVCKRTGLDPFAKQIYAAKNGNKMMTIVSIDGLRLMAQRTARYDGREGPEWYDGESWTDVWLDDAPPKAARVGVKVRGGGTTWATVSWREFGSTSGTWKRMPAHMLAKVAESHALRAAFPAELSGLYTTEEHAAQANDALSAEQVHELTSLLVEAGMAEPIAQARVKQVKPSGYDKALAKAQRLADEASQPSEAVEATDARA